MTDHPSALVSVPVEPTEAMLDAFSGTRFRTLPPAKQEAERKAYRAMLGAAPAPSSLAGGEVELDALDQELIDRGLRTIRAYDAVRLLRDTLSATTARLTGYDWNADPEGLTKQQGDAFAIADQVFADLNAAVDAHPDIELPECQSCGGTGKIEEAARMEGANQHSACVRTCDDCDGCGFAPDEEPDAILAALSPEAPARDGSAPGGWLIREADGGWIWTGARIAATAALTEGLEVGSLAALPPRHEAPAEGAGEVPEGRWVYTSACPKFEGDSDRVRAYSGNIHAGWEDTPEFETQEECYDWMKAECARRNAYEAALRARSSAPEVRS